MLPHVLVDFVVLPPGHGRSVTDFLGRDAHEAQLRCPDDVSGDIGRCGASRASDININSCILMYCCIPRGHGRERILDIVPGGTELGTQVKTGSRADRTHSQ